MKAIDRAHLDAIRKFTANTIIRNNVGHRPSISQKNFIGSGWLKNGFSFYRCNATIYKVEWCRYDIIECVVNKFVTIAYREIKNLILNLLFNMLKTFFKAAVVSILFVINMAIFTWFLSYLEVGKPTLEKTPLISNVQADYTSPKRPVAIVTQNPIPQTQPLTSVSPVPAVATPPAPVKQSVTVLRPIQSVKSSRELTAFQRTSLQFETIATQINPSETLKLETALRDSRISPSHSIVILVGPAASESNTTSPQTSKLRAQSVARIVYAYTQNIKMLYRPNLEMGRVEVEFYAPKVTQH